MPDRSQTKLIRLLWVVIGALVVGGTIAGIMLVHKTDDLSNANAVYSGDVDSLRSQLQQAKAQIPSASPTPSATAAPSTAAPAAAGSPSPTAKP